MTWCWGRRRGSLRCDCDAWGFFFPSSSSTKPHRFPTPAAKRSSAVYCRSCRGWAARCGDRPVSGKLRALLPYTYIYIFFSFSSSSSTDIPAMLKTEKENPTPVEQIRESAADKSCCAAETSVQYSPAGVSSGSQWEEREFPMFSLLWQARRPTQQELMCSVRPRSSLNWRGKK